MTQVPQRRSRFVTAILIGSLTLNALLVGFVGVQAYRRYEYRFGPRPILLEMVRRRLPAADQAILAEALKAREVKLAAAQAEYDNALAAAVAQLAQPNFNDAAFRAVVADARAKRLAAADLALDAFLDAVARISPEGRRDLVSRWRR
jgi:hypothetical protein